MKKASRTYRITDEAIELLEALARKFGISATAVVELAIREYAKRENVK